VSAKIRSGPPVDEPEDLSLEHWAGLWPLRIVHGTPQPSPDLSPGIELPAHLLAAHLLAEVRDEGADQVGGPG
jgi:hypothetical protein